jgi:hypothetical protein
MTTASEQTEKTEAKELAEVKTKIHKLAQQLNYYIQLNGCSKQLKQKAKAKLGTMAESQASE